MARDGTGSSRLAPSEQSLNDIQLISNCVPPGSASHPTALPRYPSISHKFTGRPSLQFGPEVSECLEPFQLDASLLAGMSFQNMSPLDSTAAAPNSPAQEEMPFQAMRAYDAATRAVSIHRETIFEDILLHEPDGPDNPAGQYHIDHSEPRSHPRTQDNRIVETTSTAYGSRNEYGPLGTGSDVGNLYVFLIFISSITGCLSHITQTAGLRRTEVSLVGLHPSSGLLM